MQYDVAVVGLGGIGAASLAHVARRGARAIGIERYGRLHDLGASSGQSRIIRKAYFEDPAYVPLLERAYALWHDLETETRRALLDLVGILMVGAPDRNGIAGTLRSARRYDLPLDVYDAAEIAHRFPGTAPHSDEIGLFERHAGIVFPEEALAAHLEIAGAHDAEMHFETRVTSWERRNGVLRIALDGGDAVDAARVVFAPGMWAAELLADLNLPLRVQRNVQIWFEPTTRLFDRGAFPAFFVDRAALAAPLYGFPAIDGLLKAALHGYGDVTGPEVMEREIRAGDVAVLREALDGWMPGAGGAYRRGKACAYALTPDENFIVDRHPDDPSVTIACGFSGHGYKFCPVIGEIVADLALDGDTSYDIDFMKLGRFPVRSRPSR
jgi:sarcosine oxidase